MKQHTVKHGDGETVVNYDGGEMPENEARAYVERAEEHDRVKQGVSMKGGDR